MISKMPYVGILLTIVIINHFMRHFETQITLWDKVNKIQHKILLTIILFLHNKVKWCLQGRLIIICFQACLLAHCNVQFQKYPYPAHGRSLETFLREWGFYNVKIWKGQHDTKAKFPGGEAIFGGYRNFLEKHNTILIVCKFN